MTWTSWRVPSTDAKKISENGSEIDLMVNLDLVNPWSLMTVKKHLGAWDSTDGKRQASLSGKRI